MSQKTIIKFLKGKRVYLRPLFKEDVFLLLGWVNDQEVRQYMSMYLPSMKIDEEEWINGLSKKKNTNVVLMICLNDNDRPIGIMGIHKINHKDGTATTGTFIGEKNCWGKGYGTEAKMVLLNYAFNTLNLRKICSSVYAFNKRSLRYSEKCGYIIEGTLKKHHFVNGRYVDEVLMAVFKSDFMPLWGMFRKEHLS